VDDETVGHAQVDRFDRPVEQRHAVLQEGELGERILFVIGWEFDDCLIF
jgi:hypothetical protein